MVWDCFTSHGTGKVDGPCIVKLWRRILSQVQENYSEDRSGRFNRITIRGTR